MATTRRHWWTSHQWHTAPDRILSCRDGRTASRKDKAEPDAAPTADPFAALYPHVAAWVRDGWVEVGRDDCGRAFARALDIGGTVWEGEAAYPSVHEAMRAMDAGIAAWIEENG